MIKVDYQPGTHGVFLTYVSNVYIMQMPPIVESIFTPGGIAHGVGYYPDYIKNRIITERPRRDCWEFDHTDQIIRIVVRDFSDETFFKLITNCVVRVDDRGIEGYLSNVAPDLRQTRQQHRQLWYAKIADNRAQPEPTEFYNSNMFAHTNEKNLFEFPFESFFSMSAFFKDLDRLSHFLNFKFAPDIELAQLWQEFDSKNHGQNSHAKCDMILENILLGKDCNIDCTVLEEAWLNYNLSKIFRVYDGLVFDCEQYPTNTKQIHQWIEKIKHCM
jgi:hypothetical protein